MQRGGFRAARPEKTKEQIEYEEATKNIKMITTKLRLAQQGVDTSAVSRQHLDRVMALFDKMDGVSEDVRNKTAEVQRESNIEIQKINQKANEKYSQISKDIDALINKMKKADKPADIVSGEPVGVEETKEEIKKDIEEVKEDISPEKIKEDTIGAFADRIMQKVRKEVVNAFEDYTNMPHMKITPQVTVGKGVIDKEAAKELTVSVEKGMVEKYSNVESEDRPDDKDIPVITQEMIQKTEEEINRRREEQ